jgi:hypothetical protein
MAVFSAIAARKARKEQLKAQDKLDKLLQNRQEIINPYENVTDLSGMVSNPFANLQVATTAAEMQAEQADISLANTLDLLRATGSGAGGATALAQASLRGKQGIAATIEQQELQNARLRAQGEQFAQQQRIKEKQRVEEADILGKSFMFQTQEGREVADISREAGMIQQYGQQRADALGAMGSNTAMVAGAAITAGAFGGGGSGAGTGAGGGSSSGGGSFPSDRRLKDNIKFLKLSPSGLKIYSFKYKNKEGIYQGVMSDEVPAYATIKNLFGIYDGVDYSKIDVEFKQIQ